MAWAQELPSGRWRAVYRDANGRQKSAGTHPRKRDAEMAGAREEGISRNDPKVVSDMTWAEWEPIWWASRTVEESTKRTDMSKLVHHVRPRWEGTRLSDIERSDLQAWVAELGSSGVGANTVQKCIRVMSGSLNAAVVAGKLEKNPCKGVTLPKEKPSPERFLSRDEAEAVRDGLYGFDRFIFDVLLGTGCRWGEAVALHWDHVDLENRRIEVAMSYDRGPGAHFFKATKGHAKRWLPIGDTLARTLSEQLDRVGYGDAPAMDYRVTKPRHALLLGNAEGRPWDGAYFSHRLSAAGRVAKVGSGNRARKVGHVRPHDLRHTYASWLVQANVPIQEVQKLLGHQSLVTTQRYARLGSTQWDAVRGVLG